MVDHNQELLPCPFCGNAPTEYDQIGYSSVKCKPCNFSIKVTSMDGPPYAPELWNRRAQQPASGEQQADCISVPLDPLKRVCVNRVYLPGAKTADDAIKALRKILNRQAQPAVAENTGSHDMRQTPSRVMAGCLSVDGVAAPVEAEQTGDIYLPPAAQDVSGLVEALEYYATPCMGKSGNVAREALAAHRAQLGGGE